MTAFAISIESGEALEFYILQDIKKKYPKAEKKIGYFKEFDIFIPEVGITLEIKRDYKSHFTGNFVVEVEFNGKPSALSTTTADYWLFAGREYLYWIKVERLKQCIRENTNLKLYEFIGKGDSKPKKAYLIQMEIIKSYCSLVSLNKTPYKPQRND